ncbi:MAG: hypothetical protein LBV68_08975 [Spirochaetaceae bacterium]|jgi:hypothetical protein|nr:hypothetical protein [Spirochaetaceae bacterium]
MRCSLCGRTEKDVAGKSLVVGAQINKALEFIKNKEETDILQQRIKKLDKITFMPVSFSDEVTQILEKYLPAEKPENSDDENEQLICMHCKFLVDNMTCLTGY